MLCCIVKCEDLIHGLVSEMNFKMSLSRLYALKAAEGLGTIVQGVGNSQGWSRLWLLVQTFLDSGQVIIMSS